MGQEKNDYSLKEKVYEKIYNAILVGKFSPGERIFEEEIAEQLNVSRTPVRQAMRRLEEQKLIDIIPYKGAKVSEIDQEKALELLEMCELLEVYLCEKACISSTEEDIQELRNISNKFIEAYNQTNMEKMQLYNFKFHMKIAEITDNELSQKIYKNIRSRMNLISVYTLPFSNRDKLSVEEHEEIIESIKTGDIQAAKESAAKHVQRIKKVTLEKLNSKEVFFSEI